LILTLIDTQNPSHYVYFENVKIAKDAVVFTVHKPVHEIVSDEPNVFIDEI